MKTKPILNNKIYLFKIRSELLLQNCYRWHPEKSRRLKKSKNIIGCIEVSCCFLTWLFSMTAMFSCIFEQTREIFRIFWFATMMFCVRTSELSMERAARCAIPRLIWWQYPLRSSIFRSRLFWRSVSKNCSPDWVTIQTQPWWTNQFLGLRWFMCAQVRGQEYTFLVKIKDDNKD